MLRIILLVLSVVIVALLIVVAVQPSDFRVARTAHIAAPPAAVFAQVNDFHKWEAWNPFGKLDPNMKRTYSGAAAGTGAVYAWQGDANVGEGRMTIVDSRPNELVRLNLEFFKPFAATNVAEFSFKPSGGGTDITWSMAGRNNFVAKAMHLVLNLDDVIGGQFEQGLADIKTIVEGGPRRQAAGT